MYRTTLLLATVACAAAQTWDVHTNRRVKTLHPKVEGAVVKFINAVQTELSMTVRVTDAYRTFAEQDTLYEQGRSRPGKIVTNARGGQSYHNYGCAVDVVPIANGQPQYDNSLLAQIAPVGYRMGLEWGGNWNTPDRPHFQFTGGHSISSLRAEYNKVNGAYKTIPLPDPKPISGPAPAPSSGGDFPVENWGSCTSNGATGTCQKVSVCNGKRGSVVRGLCPGDSSVACCIEASCTAGGRSGRCMRTGICALRDGRSTAGLCSGPSNIQCCTHFTSYGACTDNSGRRGTCGDRTVCTGRGQRTTSGKCPGPANIQCCTTQ